MKNLLAKFKTKFSSIILFLLMFYPFSVLAQAYTFDPISGCNLVNNPKFQNLLSYGGCVIVYFVVPLIFALALVMFIWGVVQMVINPSEEAKREKGREFMLWGIIALAVMVSVWGLVNILRATFGIGVGNFIPQVAEPKPLGF